MVAPIVAAAAPAVISSATDDEGIINKLFKIAMLVGFLLLAVFAFFILNFVISIADVVGAATDTVKGLTGALFPRLPVIGPVITGITALFSAFGYARQNFRFTPPAGGL